MQGIWLVVFVFQWIITLGLATLTIGILRYLSVVKERWDLAVPAITRYEIGETIDDLEVVDLSNNSKHLKEVIHQAGGAVLLFVSSGCSSCDTVIKQVGVILSYQGVTLTRQLIVIALGPTGSLERLLDAHPNLNDNRLLLLRDEQGRAMSQFRITASPTAVAVNYDGNVVNQTFNPHVSGWLYKMLGVKPPAEPETRGRIGLVVPAAFQRG